MSHFTVERDGESDNPVAKFSLARKVWYFWLNDRLELVLDAYREDARKTTRHRWTATGRLYQRLTPRHNTLKASEVDIPQDVAVDALNQVKAALRIKRWPDAVR